MVRRSIIDLSDRLRRVEDRLSIARRRNGEHSLLVGALLAEAAELREQLWAARRARIEAGLERAIPGGAHP